MHDCKATREMLNDLVVSAEATGLPDEVRHCETCREEYASLRSSLRIVDQAWQSMAPAESFWSGYHARLRQRLGGSSEVNEQNRPVRRAVPAFILTLFTRSVRVPVPIAAVLLLVFAAAIVLAMRSKLPLTPTQVITKTVEVPVVHEKTLTQVVYRDRVRHERVSRRANTSLIARQQSGDARAPISLSGYTPTNEVKLTIIKGSYRDEK
jgi:hypothetical protein